MSETAEQIRRRSIDRAHEIIARLEAIADPQWRMILDHHAATKEYGCYCNGCDMGCSCEAATWPCSTVRLVGGLCGIEIPEWGPAYEQALKERATIESERA